MSLLANLHAGGGVVMHSRYLGNLSCEIEHPQSGQKIQTTAPKDNGGKGDHFSPTDMVGAAMSSCMMTIIAIRLRALKVELPDNSVSIKVTKQMTKEGPRKIERLPVSINVSVDLSEKQRESLVRSARECPVKRSLHPSIKVPAVFVWSDGSVSEIDLTNCDQKN